MPIIEYYQEKNLVQKIDASKAPEDVRTSVIYLTLLVKIII